MALGSIQPLAEMSTRNISWGVKGAGVNTGLNPFNFIRKHFLADLLVRYFLCTKLLQFVTH
jgi:hypothetical protein